MAKKFLLNRGLVLSGWRVEDFKDLETHAMWWIKKELSRI